MCRILVISNVASLVEEMGEARAREFVKNAMIEAANGNEDACGFAVFYRDGLWARVRLPVPCNAVAMFMEKRNMMSQLVNSEALYLLVHARYATVGSPTYNANNHPFCVRIGGEPTCLIHNGSVTVGSKNVDDKINKYIEAMGRPETDSARLLALLAVAEGETLLERAKKAWSSVRGKASVAVANTRELLYTVNISANIVAARVGQAIVLATSNTMLTTLAKTMKLGAPPTKMTCLEAIAALDRVQCVPASATLYFRDGLLVRHEHTALVTPVYAYHYYYGYSYNGYNSGYSEVYE